MRSWFLSLLFAFVLGLHPVVFADVLTFDAFLTGVKAYYPKLIGAQLEQAMARAKRLEKLGAFDPVLSGGSEYNRYNSSSSVGKLQTAWINEAQLELPTRSGATVGVGGKLNTGDVKTPFSPTGSGGEYGITLKMPLLRGLIWNEKSAAERQAKLGETLADAEYLETRLDTLLSASQTYWEWLASAQRLKFNQQFAQLAETRAQWINTRAQAGDLPLIEAAEARQEVLRRQGNLIKADRDWQKAGFKLALYRWQQTWQPDLLAVESPVAFPASVALPQTDPWVQVALANRPELLANAMEQKTVQVAYALAKNQRLPDATLTVGPAIETGEDAAGFVMKAGLRVTAPLRQRVARGRMQQADLKLQKLALEKNWLERHITLQVQDVLNALNTTYQRLQVAEKEVAFAQKLEAAERIKFNLGDTTLFLVNQRERASLEAILKQVDIQAEYQTLLVMLQATVGQL